MKIIEIKTSAQLPIPESNFMPMPLETPKVLFTSIDGTYTTEPTVEDMNDFIEHHKKSKR